MKNQETISYLILSFIAAAIFISLFFFFYVSKVEEHLVKTQLNAIIQKLTKEETWVFLNDSEKNSIKTYLDTVKLPDMSEEDNNVLVNNSKLFNEAMKVFLLLAVFGIIAVIMIYSKYKFDIKLVLTQSVVIVSVVALTYYCFVTYISQNYVLIDENVVKQSIYKNVKKYFV